MPRDEIISLPIDALTAYAKNSRTHSDAQVEQIAASISEFGWTNPVLVDEDGGIIAGHGRVLAASRLGMEVVPCLLLDGLTQAQRRAYVIADNKLALNAGWDNELLSLELDELKDGGFDVLLTGFTEEEIDALRPVEVRAGLTDDDAAPALQPDPVTKPGDVWVCGKHRLLCGDATSVEHLERLTMGQPVDMWLTDPPYNVDYEGKTKDALKIDNDSMADGDFRTFLRDSFVTADTVMKAGSVFYIWHADSEGYNFRGACHDAGWKVRQCLIWKKQTLVMGRQDYHWKHEPCLYGWKEGAAHRWFGGRKKTTVLELGESTPFVRLDDGRWEVSIGERRFLVAGDATVEEVAMSVLEFDRPTRSTEHPTMKPVALFEYQMLNNTKGGDLVLDSFGGSGTTMIAAEKNGRYARLLELDPKYCDVIVKRWQDWTGEAATLESDGRTFAEVAG